MNWESNPINNLREMPPPVESGVGNRRIAYPEIELSDEVPHGCWMPESSRVSRKRTVKRTRLARVFITLPN